MKRPAPHLYGLRVLTLAVMVIAAFQADALQMALTVDDLPISAPPLPGQTVQSVMDQFLSALKRQGSPRIYGFVVGQTAANTPNSKVILQRWINAGNGLGSHTYSHIPLSKTTADGFISDVVRNEDLLKYLTPAYREFRYPEVDEGTDGTQADKVSAYLQHSGYRIAEVTTANRDYLWEDAYVRCQKNSNAAAIRKIKDQYLKYSMDTLRDSDHYLKHLTGRPVAHISVIHLNSFTSAMLDDLLTEYKRNGVRFITYEKAIQDPIYGQKWPNTKARAEYFTLARVGGNREKTKKEMSTISEGLNTLCR